MWRKNKLTPELKSQLKQGSKVRFKWHGNSSMVYIGRIEVRESGELYFVAEHNYKDDILIHETMRYYNPLDKYYHFTSFEIYG